MNHKTFLWVIGEPRPGFGWGGVFYTFYKEKMMPSIELIKSTLAVDPEIAAELDGLTVEETLEWWGLECVDYQEED